MNREGCFESVKQEGKAEIDADGAWTAFCPLAIVLSTESTLGIHI